MLIGIAEQTRFVNTVYTLLLEIDTQHSVWANVYKMNIEIHLKVVNMFIQVFI